MARKVGKRVMTSVYLDPSKLDALQRLSDATGRPMAEHVREGIDLVLDKRGAEIHPPSVTPTRKMP